MTDLTLPAHSLLTGDRVNLWGHWRTVGTVTLHNELPEGATVHVVLDHGTSDADLNAEDTFQVQRTVTHTQTTTNGEIRVNLTGLRAALAAGMTPADARLAAAAILTAADDADAANGTATDTMPGIPDTIDELLGGGA